MGKIFLFSGDKDRKSSWVFEVPPNEEDRALRADNHESFCAKLNVEDYAEEHSRNHPDVPPGRCGAFQFLGLLPEGKVPGTTAKPLPEGFTRIFLVRDEDGEPGLWITKGEELLLDRGVWYAPSEYEEGSARSFDLSGCEAQDGTPFPVEPGEGVELIAIPLTGKPPAPKEDEEKPPMLDGEEITKDELAVIRALRAAK